MKTTPTTTTTTKLGNNQTLPSTQEQGELAWPLPTIVGTLSAALVLAALLVFWRVSRKQSLSETEVPPEETETAERSERVSQSSPTPICTVDAFAQHGELRCRLLKALKDGDVGKVICLAVPYEEFRNTHSLLHADDNVIYTAHTFLGPFIRDHRLLQMKLYKAIISGEQEDLQDLLVTYSEVRRKHGLDSLSSGSESTVDACALASATSHLSLNDDHGRLDRITRGDLIDFRKTGLHKYPSQTLETEPLAHNIHRGNAAIYRCYSDVNQGNEVESSWLRRFRVLRDLKAVKESLLLCEKLYEKDAMSKRESRDHENMSGDLPPIPENECQTKDKPQSVVDAHVRSIVCLESKEKVCTGDDELASPGQDGDERERVCRELEHLKRDVEDAVKTGVNYRIRMATRQYRQFCKSTPLCAPDVEFLANAETTLNDIEPLRADLNKALRVQDQKTLGEIIGRICQKNLQTVMGASFTQAVKLQESLEIVKSLTTAVLNLDRETMMTMRRYEHPPKVVHDVVMGILLVLGDPESETCDWTTCQTRCTTLRTRDSPGLMKRVCDFDIRELSSKVASRALDIVKDFCEEEANVVNIGAAVLHSWVRVVCEHSLAWSEPTPQPPAGTKKRTKGTPSREHAIQEELKLKTALRQSLERKDVTEIKSRLSKYLKCFEKSKYAISRDNDLITSARQATFELKEKTFLEIMNDEIMDSLRKATADRNPRLIKRELENYQMFCAAESGKITVDDDLVADAILLMEEHEMLNDLIRATESREYCSLKEALQRYETFCHQNIEKIVADEQLINEVKICVEQKELVDSLKASIERKRHSDLQERVEDYTAFCQRNADNVVAEKHLIEEARLLLEQMDISDCLKRAIGERNCVKIELHLRAYEILCQQNVSSLSVEEPLTYEARNTLKELDILKALAQAVESKDISEIQTLLDNYDSHCQACKVERADDIPLLIQADMMLEESQLLDTLRQSVEKRHYFELMDYLTRYDEFCARNKDTVCIDEDLIERGKACLGEAEVLETLKLAVYKKDYFAIQEEMAKYNLFLKSRKDTLCANTQLLNEAQAVLERKELQDAVVAEAETLKENLKHAIEHDGSLAIKESLFRYKTFCTDNENITDFDDDIVADALAKIDGEELKAQVKAEETSLKRRLMKAVQAKAHVGVSQMLSRYECLCDKHTDILRPDKRIVKKAMKCLQAETTTFIKNQATDCESRLREGITDNDYKGVFDALEQYDLISKTYEGTLTVDQALVATARALLQKQDKIKTIEIKTARLKDRLGRGKRGLQRLEGVRTTLREYESALKEHPGLVSIDDNLLKRAYSFLKTVEPVELKRDLTKALKSSDEIELRVTFDRYEKFSEERGNVDVTIEDLAKQAKQLLEKFDHEHLVEHQHKERILKGHLKQALASQHVRDISFALADYETLSTEAPEVMDLCVIEEASTTLQELERAKAMEELQRDLDDTARELTKAAASKDKLLVESFLMRYTRFAGMGGEDLKIDQALISKCELIVSKLKPVETHRNNNKQDLADALRMANSSLVEKTIAEARSNYVKFIDNDDETADGKLLGETETCLKAVATIRGMVDALSFRDLKQLTDVLKQVEIDDELKKRLKDEVTVASKCCSDLSKIEQLTNDVLSLEVSTLLEGGEQEQTELTGNIIKAMKIVLGGNDTEVDGAIPSNLLERVKTFDLKTLNAITATKALDFLDCYSVEQISACNKPIETLYKWIDATCNCCMVADELLFQHKR